MNQAWFGWQDTLKFLRITSAMRLVVHKSFGHPCAVAPCDSKVANLLSWASVNLRGRPPTDFWSNSPSGSPSLRQRQMVAVVTPNTSAIVATGISLVDNS